MTEVQIYLRVVNAAGQPIGRDVSADDPCDGYLIGSGDHPIPRVGELVSITRLDALQSGLRCYRVVSVCYSMGLGAKCDVWLYCEFIDDGEKEGGK